MGIFLQKEYIFLEKKNIVLYDCEKAENIFSKEEYDDILNNIETDKYPYFKKFQKEYKSFEIKDKVISLFNFILLNNMANFIMDKIVDKEYEIIFNKDINEINEKGIKITNLLSIEDIYRNIYGILIYYRKNNRRYIHIMEEQNNLIVGGEIKVIHNNIEKIFYYESEDKKELRNKLERDLLEQGYIKKIKNKNNRYSLPVYIDRIKLKNIQNSELFLRNWESIAYLNMISKIHDNFVDFYSMDIGKGFKNDILTAALLDLLDSEVEENYPSGLKKSIEIGRATNGKCFFIDKILTPVPLEIDLSLILQAKDIFSTVVKVSKEK